MALNLLAHAKSKLNSLRNLGTNFNCFRNLGTTIPPITKDDSSKFMVARFTGVGEVHEWFNYLVISFKDTHPQLDKKFKFPVLQHYHNPASACNGLMLLLFNGPIYDDDDDDDDEDTGKRTEPSPHEALWNPTTSEIKILPPSPASLDPRCVKMPHGYFGFGFDSASEDYKVIRLMKVCDNTKHIALTPAVMAELYSLRTNSWKQVSLVHPFYSSLQNGVHVNGTYYWLNLSDPVFIMSFDFANDKFASSRVHLPPSEKLARNEYNDFKLVEYCGSLGAVVKSYEDTSNPFSSLEIWVWDGSKSSWSLVSTLAIPLSVGAYSLVGTDKLFLWNFKGDMMFFNCATSKLEKMSYVPTYPMDASHVFPFVENDVPLH